MHACTYLHLRTHIQYTACLDDRIRLIGGATPYEGRVEVCKVGVWGTVCDDFWDTTDASVACRQLGFSRHNANAYSMAYFGSGSTLIHLDDVACSGNETSLLNCSYDIHTGDCSHSEDAGVRCTAERKFQELSTSLCFAHYLVPNDVGPGSILFTYVSCPSI